MWVVGLRRPFALSVKRSFTAAVSVVQLRGLVVFNDFLASAGFEHEVGVR